MRNYTLILTGLALWFVDLMIAVEIRRMIIIGLETSSWAHVIIGGFMLYFGGAFIMFLLAVFGLLMVLDGLGW